MGPTEREHYQGFDNGVEAPRHPPGRAALRRGFFCRGLAPVRVTLKYPLLNQAKIWDEEPFSTLTKSGLYPLINKL